MEPIRNERLLAALARALDTGHLVDLFDQFQRNSGLPGPRPNLELARALGHAIAAAEARGDRLARELGRNDDEFAKIVAAMAFAARSLQPLPKGKRGPGPAAAALADLQELAEDSRLLVRTGIVDALRMRLTALGEAAVVELAAWTDGYLQAHVAIEAIADRTILAGLPSAEPVMARLDEAFVLADASPRAAERLQGVRTLREEMPRQIAILAARYPETIRWLEEKTKSKRPESRTVVLGAIAAMRRSVLSDLEAQRLTAALEASGKPPRDPSRIVQGTRKRGRGRV